VNGFNETHELCISGTVLSIRRIPDDRDFRLQAELFDFGQNGRSFDSRDSSVCGLPFYKTTSQVQVEDEEDEEDQKVGAQSERLMSARSHEHSTNCFGLLGFSCQLCLSSLLSIFAKTGITSYRLADNTGEDWEPAILKHGNCRRMFLASNLPGLQPHSMPSWR
jgi:hypothetical protein